MLFVLLSKESYYNYMSTIIYMNFPKQINLIHKILTSNPVMFCNKVLFYTKI